MGGISFRVKRHGDLSTSQEELAGEALVRLLEIVAREDAAPVNLHREDGIGRGTEHGTLQEAVLVCDPVKYGQVGHAERSILFANFRPRYPGAARPTRLRSS